MVWNYWSLQDLQAALSEIDASLLERVEDTIALVAGESFDPTILYRRQSLVRLLQSFSDSECFRKPGFRRACLNRLPPETLRDLGTKLGLSKSASFDKLLSDIATIPWDSDEFAIAFLEFFSLPSHFLARRAPPSQHYEDFEPPTSSRPCTITAPYKPLKDYQFQVFQEAMARLEAARARFVIQMPTGSGKTRTAMEIVAAYLNAGGPCDVVIWLAHSEELCTQALECFTEVWQHVARCPCRAVRAWGKHGLPASYELPMFVVGGFSKCHSQLQRNPEILRTLRHRVGLVVVDEAHKTIAPTYEAVIRELTSDGTAIVGLTATPGRTLFEEAEDLSDFYFNDLLGLKTPNGIGVIEYLKGRRILSNAEMVPLITHLEYTLTAAEKKALKTNFEFSSSFLSKVGSDTARNAEILARIRMEVAEGHRVLLFACSVAHSRFLAAMLLYYEIAAAHIDGGTARGRRAAIIDEFRRGDLAVLCNFGVLTTGFDAPNTDVVFVTRPTNSAVLYSQMIGRGLRGPELGGTETCRIIDVRDNIIGYGDADLVYRFFDTYWE